MTESKKCKILGVYFNQTLTWTEHLNFIKGKVWFRISEMKRLQNKVTKSTLRTVLDSKVLSIIRYGITIFGNPVIDDGNSKNINFLQVLMNHAMRCVCNVVQKDKVPIESMIENLNLMSVNQIAVYTLTMELLKWFKNEPDSEISKK